MTSHQDEPRADVVDLAARRAAAADPDPPLSCLACGGQWFTLNGILAGMKHGAVTVAASGRVTGYCGVLECVDCGAEAAPTR